MPRKRKTKLHLRVAKLVKESGLQMTDFAAKCGWNYMRLYRLLKGITPMTAADVEKFADVLKRPVADLYADESAAA